VCSVKYRVYHERASVGRACRRHVIAVQAVDDHGVTFMAAVSPAAQKQARHDATMTRKSMMSGRSLTAALSRMQRVNVRDAAEGLNNVRTRAMASPPVRVVPVPDARLSLSLHCGRGRQ
jgi:hypothetical protein